MYMKLNNNLLNIKNTHSTSETDVYSANYVNNELEKKQDKGIVLWTNLNPSSDFQDGTITLNSSDYDKLLVIYSQFHTNNQNGSVILLKGTGTRLISALSSGTVMVRNFDYVDDTHYSVNGGSVSNLYPLYVIGYKN